MEIINGNMKMAALVESNFRLLAVLSRMGIDSSLGERTVEELCSRHGLDTDTFLLLCNVYSVDGYVPSRRELRNCRVSDILFYLHRSHDYYLNDALVYLKDGISKLAAPLSEPQKRVFRRFFDDYNDELERHFSFEEDFVIPYVQSLLIGRRDSKYSIDRFEENHSNVDEKLSDLKNLIMNSMPQGCDASLRFPLLNFIFTLQDDLARHTNVEDNILVPVVRLIENPMARVGQESSRDESSVSKGEELSDREKEILVSVAQGLLNKEIADRHNISINTVITHRKNITRKTGIKTVAGLTVYAILNNLIDINSIE
ncbi:MAG: helix-turn-helix transcriptional regulator [Bacteroidales bacterium]|nr:helix-turn-helix transcriptional regulator [Bacteroidales bacterium]